MRPRVQDRLAPGLLIAMPQLDDQNFSRSVVLMLEHSPDGAFGVVINMAVDETISLTTDTGEVHKVSANVYSGGPVGPNVSLVIHGDGWQGVRSQKIADGVYISEPSVAIPQLSAQNSVPYRVIVGYAGWGPKQIESELAIGSWITSSVDAEFLFGISPQEQWDASIRALGIDPLMLIPSSDVQ